MATKLFLTALLLCTFAQTAPAQQNEEQAILERIRSMTPSGLGKVRIYVRGLPAEERAAKIAAARAEIEKERKEKTLGQFVIGDAMSIGGREFTEEDVWLFSSTAQSMAAAISNARLFEDLGQTLQDLKQAQEQLLRSEKLRSLGELAAGVAHDFNNVLGIILGQAQCLLDVCTDGQTRQALKSIEKAAKGGAQTVKRVQEFVATKAVEDFTRVDLNSIVRDLGQIYR